MPPVNPSYLLVLDLDETLIHARVEPLARPSDFQVGPYHVYQRPGLASFLRTCATTFEMAVWTSATRNYAQDVVAHIFPDEIQLAFLWDRDRCTRRFDRDYRRETWIKDLDKVRRKGYPLEQMIAVDDSPEMLRRQYGNLVRVRPYTGDPTDDELPLLARYLLKLTEVPNIRRVEKRGWRSEILGDAQRGR